jgi:hypothetical protein
MKVSIGDNLVETLFVRSGQNLIQCDIAGELTRPGNAVMQFDFPDATRPCDISSSPEGRTIAFAFRRLKLKRYLETGLA